MNSKESMSFLRPKIAPDEYIAKKQLRRELHKILATLSRREQIVICFRFGIGTPYIFTQNQIGKYLGVSGKQIYNIQIKILRTMRHPKYCLRDFL